MSSTSGWEPSSGNRNSISRSMSPMHGSSTTTVASRNSVFISAMDTLVITVPKNVKCRTAFAP